MYYSLSYQKTLRKLLTASLIFFNIHWCFAMEVPIYDFPIHAYSQNVNDYLSPDAYDYNQSLLSSEYQNLQVKQFYNHYYNSDAEGLSPWNEQIVEITLPVIKKFEPEVLESFNHQNQSFENKHYGENFKEHNLVWWNKIRKNMDLNALLSSEFREENRAIAVANTFARVLPESAPDFFHASLPGEGFPFDNLQEATIWVGTPLYVVSLSKDKAWSLVLTPDAYFSWVKSTDIAYVSNEFMQQWQEGAKRQLIAITQTEASIMDTQAQFQFSGYIGSVFPMIERNSQHTYILIPFKNRYNQAVMKTGVLNSKASEKMPLSASRKNFAKILNQLKNRPYGWGGAFFFNDCSQEMKSIFTPFGIWLPRNSGQQSNLNAIMDLSQKNIDERLRLLKEKGHPLMTIIYTGGHVILYIGNKLIDHHRTEAISYQDIWGLASANHDKRYIIGQSLFLPLLKQYPENSGAGSPAGKAIFKLVFLDELNLNDSPQEFINRLMVRG
jgi:SH3 domain (SH3b1 type)/NLPC_P60 stabilising domain, N term/NlpC/P60 family